MRHPPRALLVLAYIKEWTQSTEQVMLTGNVRSSLSVFQNDAFLSKVNS